MENAITDSGIVLFDLIAGGDLITKIIIVVLVCFSLCSWAIVFDKIIKFRMLGVKTKKFNKMFWSGQMLEDLYKKTKNNANYPQAIIFNSAMQEWESNDVVSISKESPEAKRSLKERLENVMYIAFSRSTSKMTYGMVLLGIIATTSTFFGLFGTVWGVMSSFQSIAATKETSLTIIAPGVASALSTTIIGLFAAIPALIFYTYYSNRIKRFSQEMENFIFELVTILSRELDQ